MLLSSEHGHFSLIKSVSEISLSPDSQTPANAAIRALHLADLVTELNGFCGGKLIPFRELPLCR